ncbi:MAG: hypothetical protein J6M60_02480 [Clostridia bacterium]|nr:hypothetical protein [Clostridia bacterium]
MKKKLLFLMLIIVLMLPTVVFADSFSLETKIVEGTESKVYKENDEIKIDLNISNISVGNDGMNTIEGVLEYDEDLFDTVSTSSFSGKNGWTFTFNDTTTGKKGKFVGMILSNGIKEEQEIGTITLKVRDSVKKAANATDIVIKDIATNNGTSLVFDQDKKISVPLEVQYKESNPVVIVVVIIAIIAIILGGFSILRKKSK